jgi:protein-tyrosine-phosphatase
LLAGNEPSIEKDFEVVADGRLGEAQRGSEMTDAGFVVGLGLQEAQEAQAGVVGEDLEDSGELACLFLAELAVKKRGARGCDGGDRSHGQILTAVDVLWKDAVEIDRCRCLEGAMSTYLDPVTQQHVERLAQALKDEFRGIFSVETIERYIAESLDQLGCSQINLYVPVLAHRFARERLRALGQAEGLIVKEMPEVLFVCVHNAGRSQMAAGLLAARSGGRIHVRSAGSEPAEQINPAVVEAMDEVGIDVHEEFPKPLTDEVVRAADIVITMGCGDACAIYPGKRYEDWELDDPAGQPLERVREIRDELDGRIQALVADLLHES